MATKRMILCFKGNLRELIVYDGSAFILNTVFRLHTNPILPLRLVTFDYIVTRVQTVFV